MGFLHSTLFLGASVRHFIIGIMFSDFSHSVRYVEIILFLRLLAHSISPGTLRNRFSDFSLETRRMETETLSAQKRNQEHLLICLLLRCTGMYGNQARLGFALKCLYLNLHFSSFTYHVCATPTWAIVVSQSVSKHQHARTHKHQ